MRRVSLPTLLMLLLAACSLGPRYGRPSQDVPEAFRATAATAQAAWPEPEWWRAFGSTELNALIAAARAYNQDLAAAAARIVQADAQVRIAGAPLLPQVNATGDYRYQRSGIQGSRSGGGGVGSFALSQDGTILSTGGSSSTSSSRYRDFRTYSLGLDVSYDLDFWGRNRALAEAARAEAVATRYDQETVALNVVTSVALTYFQAIEFQDRLRVSARNLADAERVLAAFRARLQVGTAGALDVSQQEALVAQIRAQVPALRNSFEQQAIALGILTGRPPERLAVAGGSLDDLPVPEVTPGLPSELLARRPDIANAEAQLIAQNANIRAARAAFYPSIQLTASGGLQSAALSAITGPGTVIAALSAALTQPIFDNGLRRGQYEQERGRFEELAANYRRTVLQAFTDVEQSLTALRYTTEQEERVRQTVAVAQRSADIARAQLQAGTIDIITALNTQSTLFNNLDLLASVRFTRYQALVNLYKALGGGWSLPATGNAAGSVAAAGAR